MLVNGIVLAAANFQQNQTIATHGATDWEAFTIGSDAYLVVANSLSGSNWNIDSSVYRWNGVSFVEHQTIPTSGAWDWEAFTIGSDTFLAVANYYNGGSHNIDSHIYRWDGTQFTQIQAIPTQSAQGWEAFTIGGDSYLAVANYHLGTSQKTGDSPIFRWNGNQFVQIQAITTSGAADWESFTIDGETYLAVANSGTSSSVYIDSRIYKWNGSQFTEIQAIATQQALDWESFTIGSDTYLAIANKGNISAGQSRIYRWNGSQFAEIQSFSVYGAYDWEPFTIGSNSYLALSSEYDPAINRLRDSYIYVWDGTQFVLDQSVPTVGARDMEFFEISDKPYLAVANNMDGATWDVDSVILGAPQGPSGALQDAIANASPGDTINLEAGTVYGGVNVNIPGVTVNLNGGIVTEGSPAFTITADDVTITCASSGGVLDGDTGSGNSTFPAVHILGDADNAIIEGCEILNWADGVQVSGDVTSFKLIGNFIHDNTDAGLQIDSGVTIDGVLTVRGNLFKANGGDGILNDGATALDAQYNSWGDIGGAATGDGVGGSGTTDATNPTFAEVFFAPVPTDTTLTETAMFVGQQITTTVDVDAAGLYGVQFRLLYDDTRLQLDAATAAAFAGGGSCVLDTATAGEVSGYCNRQNPDADAAGVDTQVITLDLTAVASGTAVFDVLTGAGSELDSSAVGGATVYVNNGGFGAEAGTGLRVILDTNDGQIVIIDMTFTGFIDLEGRGNDTGGVLQIFDQATRAGATEIANATSASSGAYSSGALTLGATTYYLYADAPLFLPTTADADTDFADSKLITAPDNPDGSVNLALLQLLGGDASDDNVIGLADATCIGADYGASSTCTGGPGASSDVNGDGVIDLLDLVLMAGNYTRDSSPWAP